MSGGGGVREKRECGRSKQSAQKAPTSTKGWITYKTGLQQNEFAQTRQQGTRAKVGTVFTFPKGGKVAHGGKAVDSGKAVDGAKAVDSIKTDAK